MSTWIPLAAAIGAALLSIWFAIDSMRCAKRARAAADRARASTDAALASARRSSRRGGDTS